MKKLLLAALILIITFQAEASDRLSAANSEAAFYEAILSNFSGRVTGRGVTLVWATVSEVRSAEFVIERRDRSGNYTAVGSVSGGGDLSSGARYIFTDATPLQGINFYRLKMVDFNGNFSYSHELQLTYRGLSPGLGRVMPNPFTNRIQLNVTLVNPESIQVRLLDVKGTTVMRQSMTGTEGENTLSIDELDRLPSGIYWVLVETATTRNSQRIFKSL